MKTFKTSSLNFGKWKKRTPHPHSMTHSIQMNSSVKTILLKLILVNLMGDIWFTYHSLNPLAHCVIPSTQLNITYTVSSNDYNRTLHFPNYLTNLWTNITLDHFAIVSSFHLASNSQFYLPHHGLFKKDSNPSKIRALFNGSAKSSSGTSLNNILHTGAKLQANIFDVLLYFRQFRFVFLTDITKMFRQILIHPDHQKFQRILWTDSKDKSIPSELSTVT